MLEIVDFTSVLSGSSPIQRVNDETVLDGEVRKLGVSRQAQCVKELSPIEGDSLCGKVELPCNGGGLLAACEFQEDLKLSLR